MSFWDDFLGKSNTTVGVVVRFLVVLSSFVIVTDLIYRIYVFVSNLS